ncbi:FecCD family ABC transporter permease [Alkalihalobacillus pseudalcaliphilus]|uniref:FecCD family ABC transporter permease n=1 Tax=Alkalihalobacillus pseudalcaliphilus TaxID=79884 RepID=UPI00064DF8B9|nr:iron ABC transporter permease [Alkalihalobacillus pseudalcaliphilus]KMK75235.1 iron ABC transporter permease [Alkalihalobacillus pseudalcaliphilus]
MDIFQLKRKKAFRLSIVILVLIIITFFISLHTGLTKLTPVVVIQTLLGNGTDQNWVILVDFRLPRMVLALLIGAGIAISGVILQSISRNALADPGIIGINAGAGFAVVLYMFLFQGASLLSGTLAIFSLPFVALIGAFTAALFIYLLAWKDGVTPTRLILVGIGINAAFNAAMVVFQLMMEPNDFTKALTWLSGSIWGTNWTYVLSLLPWIILLIPIVLLKARKLDLISLGDSTSIGLGIAIEKERFILLMFAVALAGACVSVGGGITFLGLIAPHLARRLVGSTHALFIPVAALLGSFFLLAADTLGRVILAPAEVPVGLVVAILGAPYFIYLLLRTP